MELGITDEVKDKRLHNDNNKKNKNSISNSSNNTIDKQ